MQKILQLVLLKLLYLENNPWPPSSSKKLKCQKDLVQTQLVLIQTYLVTVVLDLFETNEIWSQLVLSSLDETFLRKYFRLSAPASTTDDLSADALGLIPSIPDLSPSEKSFDAAEVPQWS